MQKAIKKAISFLLGISVLSAVVLRTVQLFIFTDIKTGYILSSAQNSAIAFYSISAIIIILCALLSCTGVQAPSTFFSEKSKMKSAVCYLTAISFFYDFIHQCLNCYNYALDNSNLHLNILIPVATVGISALACAYYFYVLGAAFHSDTYALNQLKFFHLIPAAWIFFKLLTCISNYIDKTYAVEAILQYAVLIFGIIFYMLIVSSLDSNNFKSNAIVFTGLAYSVFSLIISIPRIIAWLFSTEIQRVDFSSVTYLFAGIVALMLSLNTLNSHRKGK